MAGERTAPDVQRMGLQAEKIWREAERRIMEDVIRRIKKSGEITSTADYQINRLIEMGKSREEVERIIKEALGATWPEMFEMYHRVAEWEYVRNREIYEQVNDDFLTPEDNKWLQQITEAARKQTKDTLVNMAQSYGFSVLMAGKRVFTPFAEYYQKYVDTAIQDVVTGGTDYNSAIRKVVTQMTNSGLRVVDYASGHTNRADVAARRAVLTGVNQITAQVSEHNAEKLDTEYFEVSWHPCARPDHQTWQGKVFSRKQLETVCGYGTVTGLCGANCRHTFHPFIPGVSERLYPDDWLEEQNQKEAKTKEWNGKQLNAYEQTQQQRKMETAMRAQRQKIRLLQEAGADKDDIMLEKAKYQGQLNEYKQFSKKMGLLEQRERIYQDGLGKVATNTKQQNARYTPEMMRNAKKDSEEWKKYKDILGEDAGSLAQYRQTKYNDPEKWNRIKDNAAQTVKINKFKADLSNGNVNINVKQQKQMEHIQGTKKWQQRVKREIKSGKAPDMFYKDVDVESLIKKYAGNGKIQFRKGQEYPIEYIDADTYIGKSFDFATMKYKDTKRFAIRYSSKGVHLHPVPERS